MKYLTIKDSKRRDLFLRLELKLTYLKSIYAELKFLKNEVLAAAILNKYTKLSTKVNAIRLKNRCVITSRSKSVYRDLKLSRLMVRETVKLASAMGIRKSSW